MMTTPCGYPGNRDEIIVSYLYDAIEPDERVSFDAHLATCERCRVELADLRDLRTRLGGWAPPEHASLFVRQSDSRAARMAGVWARLGEIPAWAQVAAAMLFLGVAAGIANLDVQYGRDGLIVRTGWSRPATAGGRPIVPASLATTSTAGAVVATPPWRADLAALEQQLRNEFHADAVITRQTIQAHQNGFPAPTSGADAEVIRRVRALIDESERRQQREIALRVAEVLRDVQNQRQADLVRIDRSLGFIQNNTGIEVAKQRELLNYLVHVSQKQ